MQILGWHWYHGFAAGFEYSKTPERDIRDAGSGGRYAVIDGNPGRFIIEKDFEFFLDPALGFRRSAQTDMVFTNE